MNTKRFFPILLMLILLCSCLVACNDTPASSQSEIPTGESTPEASTPEGTRLPETQSAETQPEETQPEEIILPPLDIETVGGVVIIGKIGKDDTGWFISPEQPLNVTYKYFLDKPSVFPEMTRITMFDPKVDGVEKALYIGQTITAEGTFRFFRDDFETLYFAPYSITIGKNAEKCYGAPDLKPKEEPENLYDPAIPLPKEMEPKIVNGVYNYNVYMLSKETLELMGNDFAVFYVGFVDALLNYKTEYPCPNKQPQMY